jgi:catechol 2,3-dioxygenase-like lactoylglutathione lyase family enzyme
MTKKPTLIPELQVTNYNESLKFYTELAGFKIAYDRPEFNFAMLEFNNARLMIEQVDGNSRWVTGVLEKPYGRGMHFQIEVPDIQTWHDRFTKQNYPIFFNMEEKWYRMNNQEVGNKQFLVQDPDGYLLRFFEDLGARDLY